MDCRPSLHFPTVLGDWRVQLVVPGRFALDGGAMFGSVPRVLWQDLIPPDSLHRIPLVTRLLLLRNAALGATVLVDTGLGNKFDDRLSERFAIANEPHEPQSSPLEAALLTAGVDPQHVTHVILTHLHFDHAGGATLLKDGALVPTFPSAQHFLQRTNLQEAESPHLRERASYLPENWRPLLEVPLTLLEGEEQVLPGLTLAPSEGHTSGMQTLRLESEAQVLYYVADLAPTRHHVRLPFTMGYDQSPKTIVEEKKKLWDRAIAENAVVVFEHDSEVAAGTIRVDDSGYRVDLVAPAC